jgi:hypothetical protein
MVRLLTVGCLLCLLLAALPTGLFAQVNPYGNRNTPYASGADPRLRRAYREKAVAEVGPIARDFVETWGDEAVIALFACSRPVAVMLAEFHASGGMAKFPRPRDLLCVIAQPGHGDDVAVWAMYHAGELADVDSYNAFLISPLDYALGLKKLSAGAAEVRAYRGNQAAPAATPWATAATPSATAATPPEALSGEDRRAIAGAGLLVLVGLVAWWRRRRASVC